jgi:hypothetical protein
MCPPLVRPVTGTLTEGKQALDAMPIRVRASDESHARRRGPSGWVDVVASLGQVCGVRDDVAAEWDRDIAEYADAAVFLGAADGLRERGGIPRDSLQVSSLDPAFARATAELGSRWSELVTQGKAMTAEDVLAQLGRADATTES